MHIIKAQKLIMFKNELYKAQELNGIIIFTENCDAFIKVQKLFVIIFTVRL